MDALALCNGLVMAAVGAAVCYRLVRRDWLTASANMALGTAFLLNTATYGSRSRTENTIVLAVSGGAVGYFAVASFLRQRHVRRSSGSAG